MEPGIYEGMSYAEYDKIEAARHSDLLGFRRAPAVVKQKIEDRLSGDDDSENEALNFGKSCHVCVLQPELYASEVAIWSGTDRRTKEGKAAWEQFEKDSIGKIKLKPEEDLTCRQIAAAVRKVKAIDELVIGATCELVLVWIDRETGVKCKARIDGYRKDLGVVFDFKTTRAATRFAFEKSVYDYGYHTQGAFYREGMVTLGLIMNHFVLIAAEKEPPFLVGLYRLKNDVLDYAHKENTEYLKKFSYCSQMNVWPGLDEYAVDLGLPAWITKKI